MADKIIRPYLTPCGNGQNPHRRGTQISGTTGDGEVELADRKEAAYLAIWLYDVDSRHEREAAIIVMKFAVLDRLSIHKRSH